MVILIQTNKIRSPIKRPNEQINKILIPEVDVEVEV